MRQATAFHFRAEFRELGAHSAAFFLFQILVRTHRKQPEPYQTKLNHRRRLAAWPSGILAGASGQNREQEKRTDGRAVPTIFLLVRDSGLRPVPNPKGASSVS